MKILVLGGTTEASDLARRLAGRPNYETLLSLAGRTRTPAAQAVPTRIGGFGGVEGLARCLAEGGFDLLVDATHPFAAQISANAVEASNMAGIPLAVLTRPAWQPVPGDRWTMVDDLTAAATAIGETPRRVLLTVGRLGLSAFLAAPRHHYLVRTIDPPDVALPDMRLILARGPFDAASEGALMDEERIEAVVTKNSGGAATYGKIEAARERGLPVILVRPPSRPDRPTFTDAVELLAWIEAHVPDPALRGV